MYTVKDLEEWSENHDSFRHEQNLVQWTEKKRPYVEALFIVVVSLLNALMLKLSCVTSAFSSNCFCSSWSYVCLEDQNYFRRVLFLLFPILPTYCSHLWFHFHASYVQRGCTYRLSWYFIVIFFLFCFSIFSMCTLIFAHMALQVTNGVGKDFVINNGACSCSTYVFGMFYSLLAFLLIDLVVLKWFHLIYFSTLTGL